MFMDLENTMSAAKYKMQYVNYGRRTRSAFTLVELTVAVALLAMMISFATLIFDMSIDTHRVAMANAEIMQKLQAITGQLNADFEELRKDGYLILRSEVQLGKREYQDSDLRDFRADKLYYFSTGDSQSWFDTDIRSGIARIYFGHEGISIDNAPVSEWLLARDVQLITPGEFGIDDCNGLSYAEFKANVSDTLDDADSLFDVDPCDPDIGVQIDIQADPNDIRSLMCEGVGEMIIEWTDGVGPNGLLDWEGGDYEYQWTPDIPQENWPKALKFTFTLYDSKGVLEGGRTFTHIVYLD